MTPPEQTPFARLVEHLRDCVQSTDPTSIPSAALLAFKGATRPLDDTGLQDLVELLEGSHRGQQIYLDSTILAPLIQIIFQLQPSLLQQKLIYTLLAPPQAADLTTFKLWRRSVSTELIPTILSSIQEGTLTEAVLITAAHSLALFIDGDEEARRAVHSVQERLRHALGTTVTKHKSYALRIAVANLIREFLRGRPDRHLFWPNDTSGASINDFPLADVGDIEWLTSIVKFLCTANASNALPDHFSELYIVQCAEFGRSVATISDNITLVLPANSQHALRFLQLPFLDGMACQSADGSDNEVIIQYCRATGHHISHGVKRATDEIHLVLADHAERISFTDSVKSKTVKMLSCIPSAHKRKLPLRKTSFASIDLNQSRETSIECEEEIDDVTHASAKAVSTILPSSRENQDASVSQHMQEQSIEASRNSPKPQINSRLQLLARNLSSEMPHRLQSACKKQVDQKSTKRGSVWSSDRADRAANETTKKSQRQLKRPSTKDARNAKIAEIDWDKDLRDESIDTEAPVTKKAKITSKKAENSRNKITKVASQSTSKTGMTKPKPSIETIASTKTRRLAVKKSAKYVDESDYHPGDVYDGEPSLEVQDFNSLVRKTLPTKQQLHVRDGQVSRDGSWLNMYEPESTKNLAPQGSSHFKPLSMVKEKNIAQEEAANDFLPMDTTTKVDTLAQNNRSFGTKVAQTLTAKAQLLVATTGQSSKKSFGDAKEFVETVNMTRNNSPQKSPVVESRNLRPKSRSTPLHQKHSNNRGPVASIVWHSPGQVLAAKLSEQVLKTSIPDPRPEGRNEQSNGIDIADEEAAPMSGVEGCSERITSAIIPNSALVDSAASGSIPQDGRALDQQITMQVAYTNTVAAAITSTKEINKDNQTKDPENQESPEAELSNPAVIAPKWSPSKLESSKMLQDISKGIKKQNSTKSPPLSSRLDRHNGRSPTSVPHDESDSSLAVTDEYLQRKTPMVKFGAQGPRNQGVLSPSKHLRVVYATGLVPSETGNHVAARIKKKAVSSDPAILLTLAATSDKVSSHSSGAMYDDEGILIQDGNASGSLIVGHSSKINSKDGAVLGHAADVQALASTTLGRNTSYSSKVDKNGSPRLRQPRKSLSSPVHLRATSITSATSKSSALAANEPDHPIYTEETSSSPEVVYSEHVLYREPQLPKDKMTQTGRSIGLQNVLSEKFPGASKSMDTEVFKKQTKCVLSGSAMIIEKRSTISNKARNGPQTKPAIQPQPVHAEIDRAPPLSHPRRLLSDPDTYLVRLGPKTPAAHSKCVKEASPTYSPFDTGLKKMLKPLPSLPPLRQGQTNLKVIPEIKCKRKNDLAMEDEDLNLADDEGSVEPGHVQPANLPGQHQSLDFSTDSESSPVPEKIKHKGLRNEDPETCSLELRATQQHILSILNCTAMGVLFRLQAAEQAIHGKTHDYHLGCYSLVEKLQVTYEACIQHESSRAAPRVAELYESYNETIEYCSKGLSRVRGGEELSRLSEKIEESRNKLLSLIDSQMEETDRSEQEAEL